MPLVDRGEEAGVERRALLAGEVRREAGVVGGFEGALEPVELLAALDELEKQRPAPTESAR
jgi:hypothetical protein